MQKPCCYKKFKADLASDVESGRITTPAMLKLLNLGAAETEAGILRQHCDRHPLTVYEDALWCDDDEPEIRDFPNPSWWIPTR